MRQYADRPGDFSMRVHHNGLFKNWPNRIYEGEVVEIVEIGKTRLDLFEMSPQSIKTVFYEMDEPSRKIARAAIQSCCRRLVLDDIDNDPFMQLTQLPIDVSYVGKSSDLPYIEPSFSSLDMSSFASQPVDNSEGPLVIIDNENRFQEHDSFDVSVFKETKEKPLEKVVRPLVDGNNNFEEPDMELQNVGGEPIDGNNIEEEGDVDITLFQQSDTSHLLNVGDETIEANENNVTEENHVQDALVQQSQSHELGKTHNSGMPKVTPESVDDAVVETSFYCHQSYPSAKHVKEKVRDNSIETRKELLFLKNDKKRIRVRCVGCVPLSGPIATAGLGIGPVRGPLTRRALEALIAGKNDHSQILGPWLLLVGRDGTEKGGWTVRRYNDQHTCLQSRSFKHFDLNFISKKIKDKIKTNPRIPVKSVHSQLTKEFELEVSMQKILRAKRIAHVERLCSRVAEENPNTTVVIHVERPAEESLPTREFKRQLLGINAYPIEGPLKGHLLVAVGIDSNNGIYPFAYAFVESENTIAWTWFLNCLSDDLDLDANSVFTFVTDMKKHRYCLRSIHDKMKVNWPGRDFKDHLWRCATASTVVQFEKSMDALKTFSETAHAWLSQIPPIHWSSIRIHQGIYCMKRIMHVATVIEKSDGPLTPTAQHVLEGIKKEAIRYNVLWNGGDKFQVTGPWGDQCVVNIVEKSCTCRRWEITGLPCKHVVATNWNMALNRQEVGAVETWAHPCYYLNTWEATYKHNVSPITSNEHWEKSSVPTTIVPPKSQPNAANSTSKKRVRLALETEEIVKNGKLSKAWKSVRCSVCGIAGHNRKTCLGIAGTQSSQTGLKRQKCSTAKGKGKQVPQKVASKKTHPTSNKVAADKQTEGTGADESQDVAIEDQGTQDVATEKQDEFAGIQSQSQDQPIDESQCQSQQQDLSQSQSQVHSSNVQVVSISSQHTTRRVTKQQAFMDRMMPSR
ncbi:hypothetical protein CTI12_AA115750 [Artemisia annua]|uniref:SWIM-type domain-containing protein n=1 Tax=Artemisia annua TaxID=35608 RepID=A0A2U1NQ70_ARTAN|nr:hypothetical protein CTI12_AA115750 [Artemisia annua]